MKKLLTLTFTISLTLAIAQVNSTIKPLSFNLPDIPQNIAQFELPAFNLPEAELADEQDEKNGELPKFSRSIFTDITLTNAGNWIELSNGDRLWRVKIKSDGAQALLLYYNKFFLPTGATLHVYTENKTEIRGAFTSFNNPRNGYFATGLTHGESCIIEYFEPVKVKGQGIISLNEIGHAYRWVNSIFPNVRGGSALGFNQSDACEVNINCEEGNDWQNEKRAVSCIIVQSQQGQGICSGTLINNVREDCTPYLLSAQHCSEFVSSNQYAQWIFHFNYESPDCNNPNSVGTLDDDFVVGCTKKADSDDNGGDTGSDFLLLELNQQPPTAFNVYYAGWDAAPTAPTGGVCIHHPEGDIKKISTYQQTGVNTSWGGSSPGTHWRIKWVVSTNGHGVTEPGSSGSAIFNTSKKIVGTLTGGDSFCSSPNSPDFFGKISYHFTLNGNTASTQLKPWLDPDNTGTTAVNGRNADCFSSSGNLDKHVNEFEIYPNPALDICMIRFSEKGEKEIVITDVSGRIVLSHKAMMLIENMDLSLLSSGIYFVRVDNLCKKLLIE
ncbi:MAG: T9SS type A sorting domain-containing protein [Chitinophagales bacterium]|nr:T9SS type A sorting domain-containing protein [Chitinophagales bacterium]